MQISAWFSMLPPADSLRNTVLILTHSVEVMLTHDGKVTHFFIRVHSCSFVAPMPLQVAMQRFSTAERNPWGPRMDMNEHESEKAGLPIESEILPGASQSKTGTR